MSEKTTNESDQPVVDLWRKGDISQQLAPASGRNQSMHGFDPDYADIVDYIVRITHRIWEEKGVGLIYDTYQHNCLVHTPYGDVYGRDAVVAGTVATLAALPDRKLYADDVIWTGNDQEGFHTSHRITNLATNTGYSAYGPPTGRRVLYRGIANCLVKDNRIVEEWLVRDELHLIRQLGFEPRDILRRRVEAAAGVESPPRPAGETGRIVGQTVPQAMPHKSGAGFDVEDFVRRSCHEIWNWRMLNKVADYYADGFKFHGPSGRDLYGQGNFVAFILALMQAFPDAALHVDQVYWLGDAGDGYRVACRWTLDGTHSGYGLYGPATNRRAQIMGISHYLIRDGRFVEEWTVFDEFALLLQLAGTG